MGCISRDRSHPVEVQVEIFGEYYVFPNQRMIRINAYYRGVGDRDRAATLRIPLVLYAQGRSAMTEAVTFLERVAVSLSYVEEQKDGRSYGVVRRYRIQKFDAIPLPVPETSAVNPVRFDGNAALRQ